MQILRDQGCQNELSQYIILNKNWRQIYRTQFRAIFSVRMNKILPITITY